MFYDGKTYRNLQDQVGYLTGKYDDLQDQINDVRGKLTHYVVVDTLPTGDDIDPSAVYLLGPMGTEPDTYYEEWVYVQKADETWMWEKLGDTDSVDLSGYLEKDTTETTDDQAYIKNANGTQGMLKISLGASGYSIAERYSDGTLAVGYATGDNRAASKGYCDDHYVAKQTGATTYYQVYGKLADGSQAMQNVSETADGSIVKRKADGRIYTPNPSGNTDATNKQYVDNGFVARRTGTTTYAQAYLKLTDGSSGYIDLAYAAVGDTLVKRTASGQVACADPTDASHAATKNYVDAAVGQLLYLHKLVLTFADVSGTDDLEVLVYLVNGSPTAITSPTTDEYCRMTPSHGLLGSNTVAITKFPPSVAYDILDYPRWNGFMYQYFSGGNLISAVVDSDSYTMTVTDVVVNF